MLFASRRILVATACFFLSVEGPHRDAAVRIGDRQHVEACERPDIIKLSVSIGPMVLILATFAMPASSAAISGGSDFSVWTASSDLHRPGDCACSELILVILISRARYVNAKFTRLTDGTG